MPNRTIRHARLIGARFPVLAVVALLLASLTSCGLLGGSDEGDSSGGESKGGANGPLEQATIKVGVLPVVDVGPLYLGIDKGYFKDEGLTIEPVVMASGPASIDGIISGDIDIAFASYPAPIVAQSKGVGDFKILAEALAAKPGHVTLVSTPNSTLKKPQDVIGKRIAITAKGSFSDLAPMAVLESQNVQVTADNVEWVQMKFPDMIPALQRGDVDGAVLVEPWRTVAEKQIGATVVLDCATGPNRDMPMSGYVAIAGDGKFGSTAPNTIAAFQRAMAKAQAAAADRKAVEPLLVEHAKIDKSIAPLMTIATFSTSLDPKRVQRVADLLDHFKVIPKPVDVKTMIVAPPESSGK